VRRTLTALLCVLLLAACGSSSNRLSREEYAKRADAICRNYNEKTKSLGTPTDPKGLVKLADRTLPLLDDAVAKLRKLRPPEDEQALSNRWLASLAQLRSDVVDIRASANANDLLGVAKLVPTARRHLAHSNLLATQLGTHVCNKTNG
jgi:hypothetical protein